MNEMTAIAPVRKTVRVKAPIAHAFEVFTSGLTRWWPHDSRRRQEADRESSDGAAARRPLAGNLGRRHARRRVATITLWEPPHRLVMLWQVNAQWKPDMAMKSEVDVRFTADGPDATEVELVHHKFETMGAEAGASMRNDVDRGWPGLIERFAQEAERRS